MSVPLPRALEVVPIPALRDNYAYLVIDRVRAEAVIVDPSEAAPVAAALAHARVKPVAIWCTHHHGDHVGGIPELARAYPGLPVYGSAYDFEKARIPGQTHGLRDGATIEHGDVAFEVLAIPGHTLGAIAYVGGGMAFTGDTLFLAGCGRVFEGTMVMMRASLARLRALDRETRIYCGHEYTERNLEFAAVVEPHEVAVAARLRAVRAARRQGRPTVPGTIAEELATNPFLRWDSSAVRTFARSRGSARDEDEIFARVREAKDAF
jgi:hydroxyacylglutathione hydrolase